MIKIVIPNRKKPTPIITYPAAFSTQTTHVNVELYREAQRRDNIIKELVKNLTYKVGDSVVPMDDTIDEPATVVGICGTYAHLGHEYVWPVNDNPLIVTCRTNKTGVLYFCSTNYLKKA